MDAIRLADDESRGFGFIGSDSERSQKLEILHDIVQAALSGDALRWEKTERSPISNRIIVEQSPPASAGQGKQGILPAIGGEGNQVDIGFAGAGPEDAAHLAACAGSGDEHFIHFADIKQPAERLGHGVQPGDDGDVRVGHAALELPYHRQRHQRVAHAGDDGDDDFQRVAGR